MDRGAAPKPRFFATPAQFRAWLARHSATATELLVGFHKKGSGQPSITWPEAVAEALCVGWIDGVRRNLDADSYSIRFTPRKPTSNWSAVNIALVEELSSQGRMQPAGLAAFARRSEKKSGIYAYEQRDQAELDPESAKRLRANAAAWKFFQGQPPWYRHLVAYRIVSAKKEATRQSRLAKLIEESAQGRRV